MPDFIDVKNLKTDFCEICSSYNNGVCMNEGLCKNHELIDKQPIVHIDDTAFKVQAELCKEKLTRNVEMTFVRHGHWELVDDTWERYQCSECEHTVLLKRLWNGDAVPLGNYCPNCGANMKEDFRKCQI